MEQPVKITKKASSKIIELLKKAPRGTQGLCLNVKPTGCSGNSYAMEYVDSDQVLDRYDIFEGEGAALYISKIHSWMLFGMTVDYGVDELGNSGFQFSNPNESGRCGCGESFYVDVDELKKLQDKASEESSA